MSESIEQTICDWSGITPDRELIKKVRFGRNLTQEKAAELIYCSRSTWEKWENGQRVMHPAFWALFLYRSSPLMPLAHYD